MYHIHTTKAVVLGTLESGEGHRFIILFTKDFGVVRAKAQSIRSHVSKLRFALQEFSFVNVSLVKGKDIWRVTNAEPLFNLYFEFKNWPEIFAVFFRYLSLIKRYAGEEVDDERIFDDLSSSVAFILKEKISEQALATLEWVLVLRMLYVLGYVEKSAFEDICAHEFVWSQVNLKKVESKKASALEAINHALQVSQL